MQAHQFLTRFFLIIFLSFVTPQSSFSQSKFAVKAAKAHAKQNWKKFNLFVNKQRLKDSLSFDYTYLRYLSSSTPSSPQFTSKSCYENTLVLFKQYNIISPKNKEAYCKTLNLCDAKIVQYLDSSLERYLNELLAKNDTIEIQTFIISYHDSMTIRTVQSFILHYLQKYISTVPTSTVKILETKYAWHEAIAQKDLNAILLFRDKYPNSFCDSLAYVYEAFFAFQHALQINTVEEFQYIKDKYIHSNFANSADSAIAIIAFNQLPDKYKIADLVEFNSKFKNTPLNAIIANRIIGLDKLDSVVKLVNQRLMNFEPVVPKNVKIEQGSITINGAKKIRFNDQNIYRKTAIVHSYLDYLPMFDAHLVRVDNYEKSIYLLVNGKTGKKHTLRGAPVFCLRIDSSVNLVCKIQNKTPLDESGFQIVKLVNGELKITQEILLDTSDFSQYLDSIYTINGNIQCKISDFIAKSLIYVPFGTLEFKHGDTGWIKANFEPAIGDYQKVLDEDFLRYWIKLKMPIFKTNSSRSFYRKSKSGFYDSLDRIDGCLFPLAFQKDSANHVHVVCTQKPLKGTDFNNLEKYKSLGLDLDFIYFDLKNALMNREISAFPSPFLEFNRISNVYNLNLFQQQYNLENDLLDFDYCYLLNRTLFTFDETLKKDVLTKWAVNFVQFKNNHEQFFNDIKELPLLYTVKVNLEEYNVNNHSFNVRADKSVKEQLKFVVPADGQNDLMNELSGVNVLNAVNGFSIEHNPTMVFNKGSESDFTIFVNDVDAQKINKLQDKNHAVYLRIKGLPKTKVIGKFCKGCDSRNCDEYKLRNCKLEFTAEQYEFSASPDFTQSIILKQ